MGAENSNDKGKILVQGTVLSIERGGLMRVEVPFGDKTIEVMAYPSGKMKQYDIKIVVGDIVDVELSQYDLTKGRVVFRKK